MSEFTQKYVRPPPAHPVPFSGFVFAKIPSRKPVERSLRQFLKKTREANTLTVAIVKAEWGEGKTDAFERYIKPEVVSQGDIAYLVSTSTIINKLSKSSVLFPTNPPESVTLFTTIFYSIIDELKARDEDYSLFPERVLHEDPLAYIKKTLRNHLISEKNKKRMYIFIDEFEEILIHPIEYQKKILSGLKELINGQLKIIHMGGEFQGCVHFLIACTPYAYNRLREDIELKEIFGSISSRIGLSIIDLPQISRKESIHFLIDILKFCYDGKLPNPLPIKSSGILNGISTISQRNLRPMIQFIGELLNAASTDSKLSVIDYEIFIETLKGKEVSVYGEATSCIDNDLWMRMEKALINVKGYGEKCVKLLKLLAGEFKPFSLYEIEQRLGFQSGEIHNLVEIINQELSKIGISNAITRLAPLKKDKDIDHILNFLKPVGDAIVLDKTKIPLEKFKEELIHYEIEKNGEIQPIMVFPRNYEDLIRLFEIYEGIELDEEEAKSLWRRVEDCFEVIAKETRFMLSKELSQQIFPSPIVTQIDFIEDRQKRMGLWREAVKNFTDMGRDLRDGFIEVINSSDGYKISGVPDTYTLRCSLQPGQETEISTAIYATTVGVNMNDIEAIKSLIRRENVNLVLLVYSGTLDEEASKEISNMPKVLPVHIKTIRAQQLIVLSLARSRNIKVSNKLLRGKLGQIFYEIGFVRLFNGWIDKCKSQGILITELIKTFGEKDASLADAMVYYLEMIDKKFTFDEVFEQMQKLKSFTLYGSKGTSFNPFDIDNPQQLKLYQEDLLRNGFLKEAEAGKIEVVSSPIEQRILELVQKGVSSLEEIKREFVIFAQNKDIIEQVYLPILQHKGLIQMEKNTLALLDVQQLEQKLAKAYKEYIKRMDEKRNTPWWDYAHICISKKRESKVIMLEDFDNFVRELWNKYENLEIRYNKKLSARLFHLLEILLNYFEDTLEKYVNEAFFQGKEILKKIDEHFSGVEALLSRIVEEYNKYSDKKYSLMDVEEYNALNSLKENIKLEAKKKYTKEEIEKELELLDSIYSVKGKYEGYPRYFFFQKKPEEASYFNYKVYEIKEALNNLLKKCEDISAKCENILDDIKESVSLGDEIKSKLVKYNIVEIYKLSKIIHNLLLRSQIKPIMAKPLATLSLNDISSLFDNLYATLRDYNLKIEGSLTYLNLILEEERTLISAKESMTQKATNIQSFFEGFRTQTGAISKIISEIDKISKRYESLIKENETLIDNALQLEEINQISASISKELKALTSSLENLDKEMQNLCSETITYLNSYQLNIEKLLEVLKESREDATVLQKAFKETIEEAVSNITNLSLGTSVKITWKSVENDLEQLKSKLFERVRKILSEEEFNAMLVIVEISKISKWLDLSEVMDVIMSRLGKSKHQALEIIERLTEKKLLRKGISLPV